MTEEQNRVVKTYPDGVRATLTLDSQTGAILDYSIDNSNKQPNAAAAANILGEDGKVKADLLPDSCKGEHCEAQPLPSDVVRTADIEDVVRKSALFDTAHNMILPELIPEAEVAVKWLKGKGRPDKPETTEGAIVGDEEDCTRYLSTDGAGTGAWEWEKRGGTWHVVRGDTGWRALKFSKESVTNREESFFLLRRVGDTVFAAVGGDPEKRWGTPIIKLDKEIRNLIILPRGFICCNQILTPINRSENGVVMVDTIGVLTNYDADSQTDHNSPSEGLLQVRLRTDVWNSGTASSRASIPEFNYSTVEPWPDTLPGDSFGICYV